MNKTITISLILSLHILSAKAQTLSQKSIQKGNITVTSYFGFPNKLITTFKSDAELANHNKKQLTINGCGPIGISASYLVADNLGVGGEISYTSARIQWKESELTGANDSTTINPVYHFILQAKRIRVLVKLNYHFVTREHSTWYFDAGLGYNHTAIKLDTDAPGMSENNFSSLCLLPLSAQTNIGFTYFLTKNIGINAEAGIGGPLISAGIMAKF
jgi:hypothetical protein